MNEEQMIQVLEENAKIVAKLIVVLQARGLIKDNDVRFIFDADFPCESDDKLEID